MEANGWQGNEMMFTRTHTYRNSHPFALHVTNAMVECLLAASLWAGHRSPGDDYPQPLPWGRQQPGEGDSLVNKELCSEWDSTGESGCSSTITVSETRSVRGGGTEK